MVVHGSPTDEPISDLSDEQYRALRKFIVQHLHEDTCSTTPVRLARVLAHDKPATLILTPPEISPLRNSLVRLRSILLTFSVELIVHIGRLLASQAGLSHRRQAG